MDSSRFYQEQINRAKEVLLSEEVKKIEEKYKPDLVYSGDKLIAVNYSITNKKLEGK